MLNKLSRALKINWIIFLSLTLFVTCGFIKYQSFHTPTIRLKLVKGDSATVTLTRLNDAKLGMSLNQSKLGRDREDFGDVVSEKGHITKFDIPYPIQLNVSNGKNEKIYHALDVSSWSSTDFGRSLAPIIKKSGMQTFDEKILLNKGKTNVTITVSDFAPELKGEEIKVGISPPVSFKFSSPAYNFWWWFSLTIYYAMILACYLLILLIWTWRGLKKFKKIKTD